MTGKDTASIVKPPSLLEISPFQINPPNHKRKSERVVKNQNDQAKNNNIPSLLSLEISPQEKPEPVSLLSLNFEPRRPPLTSLVNPRLVNNRQGSGSGAPATTANRNVQGPRNGHIPSLFECDLADNSAPSAQHPLLITPPVRQMILPGTFPSNFPPHQFSRAGSLDSSVVQPLQSQSSIPSLLSPELAWMGCEPPERVSLVPRTTMNGPRGRRKYCFNCYGYDHTAAGCSNPKNLYKRQWLQDGMK